jgi:hypothetical protein
LKKYLKTDNPLKDIIERIRKDNFKGKEPQIQSFFSGFFIPGLHLIFPEKILVFTLIFLLSGLRALAPESNSAVIHESSGIKPFSVLMYATAMVETMGNTLAYNEKENAVGIFQIRQVRVDEYNRLTGSNFVLKDMFDYTNSEKVFLYFASRTGPYNFERIAKRWNGSGPRTEMYWKRIKKYL